MCRRIRLEDGNLHVGIQHSLVNRPWHVKATNCIKPLRIFWAVVGRDFSDQTRAEPNPGIDIRVARSNVATTLLEPRASMP